MKPAWRAALVFVCCFVWLAFTAIRTPLAGGFIDPVGHIRPQDEAVYGHISMKMAASGDWLTPRFMGRPALFKPPLLYWLSAASVKLFGDATLSLRLPSLLAGALLPALLAIWIGGSRGILAGILLISNPLWYLLARANLTDALLTVCIALALVAASKDRRGAFAAATAAALLTKGIAGLLPVIAVGVWWALSPRAHRTPLLRWVMPVLSAFALAAPWFLFQSFANGKWFWTEFVQVEILGFSFGAPPQTTAENAILFFARRLLQTDPVLLALLAAAIPAAWKRWKGVAAVSFLVAWILAVLLACFSNQYRNFAYLLPAIPAMCWMASAYGPWKDAHTRWVILAMVLLTALRIYSPGKPWGLPSRAEEPSPAVASIREYAKLHRPHDLVLMETGDEFAATTFGIPRLRYSFYAPEEAFRRYGLDVRSMGIALTVDEFANPGETTPRFAQRLQEWGVNSTEAIGTVIVVSTMEDIARLLTAGVNCDFVLPAKFRELDRGSHHAQEAGEGFVLLLARD
ncbi:MAG: glycosyltransferase family 39 protein [Candidatus Solibacter usitatus]|nr:glycosyltransferase family 39 protein [Candidatus Solibacter usitatus]